MVGGRDIRLDILAKDSTGKHYNVEVQKKPEGAHIRRARFNSSMMDSRMLKAGQEFSELQDSYIVFITQTDIFGYGIPIYMINRHFEEIDDIFDDGSHIVYVNEKGRHIYTFENICKEDNSVFLKDGAVKIFLNADSDQDDVSQELKAFLDYVAGKEPADDFVQRLREAVEQARKNREWRHEYMTLLMRDQENIEKGKIYGAISMCHDLGLGGDEILEKLQIKFHLSHEEAEQYVLDSGI